MSKKSIPSTPRKRGRPSHAASPVAIGSAVVRQSTSDSVLARFDDLPDSAIVRVNVVSGLFGCSVSSIWRLSKSGKLPAPIKLSDAITGWRVGELRRVLSGVAQ